MKAAEAREAFLSFFESRGARRLPSSSLIPDDPSLLLTSAGMVQFKPVFLGAKELGFPRAVTVQKCVRTTDIDIIGTTGRHHSFFEMLGNFSFGDYFKSEACAWAYEFSTDVLGLDPERIWYSVYEDDDEAEAIWINEVGAPAERVVRMDAKDNFWSAGPTGPCGPCSELYYDQGEEVGCGLSTCAPGCDCDRYVEYWNLVFMQYDRQDDGTLVPLPRQNIDTGMGLERIAAILQGVPSNFETDEIRSIIALAEEISRVTFGTSAKTDVSLRILADHARAVTFLVADGVLPSNEGRGYVLRRLLRRAIRHARVLGVDQPFMNRLVDQVIRLMGEVYPELVQHKDLINGIVASEEERFGSTLRIGMSYLDAELAKLKGGEVLDGRIAFTLHDTYGFPFELTAEIAAEKGMSVDEESFSAEMEAQRERARAHVKDESWNTFGGAFADIAKSCGPTGFLGYEDDETDATVVGLVVDGEAMDSVAAGMECDIVLDRTPFYGEKGGQVGDAGWIEGGKGARAQVRDTRMSDGLHVHAATIEEGVLAVGDAVRASIDIMRRERIRRNHTATHLLHWALRLVLGEHAVQAGSLVRPDRLRFDFTHFESLTAEQLGKIEGLVNRRVFEDLPVRSYETSLASARDAGVTALFGEKYGEYVRVLEVGDISGELCGGTHVAKTSEIGFVKILNEGSVGANLRRIEAISSFDAYEHICAEEAELVRAAQAMRVSVRDVSERASALVKRVKALEADSGQAKGAVAVGTLDELEAGVVNVGYRLVVSRVSGVHAASLRTVWDALKERGIDAVVLLGEDVETGKAIAMAAGDDQAVGAGFNAGQVIKEVAPSFGGRGGGRPAMAQGGGDVPAGIDDAIQKARELLDAER
ncbi:MAG: alanine--tRNA ligase [Coriobacteriia bacterium]|nr:alanine--tRNA ligase [Coriobacteriia bacterium]